MTVKVKEKLKKHGMLKITTNLKNIFYEDKEIQDIMNEFYLIKRNFKGTVSFSFVRTRIFDRARIFTRTFDRDFFRGGGEYNDLSFY